MWGLRIVRSAAKGHGRCDNAAVLPECGQARQLLPRFKEGPERLQPITQPDLKDLLCATLAWSMAPGVLAERTGPRPETVRAVVGHGPDLDRSDVSGVAPERHARDPVLGPGNRAQLLHNPFGVQSCTRVVAGFADS